MIIAINGKIGAGKDTVGKIIQYLDWQKFENAPYTSFESWLTTNEYNNLKYKTSNIKIKKFAGKLKEIASILTGIPIEKFEDQEFKRTYLSDEWKVIEPNKFSVNGKQGYSCMTVRELLQKLGTEAMRNGLHTNVWVNALFADYRPITCVNQTIWCSENQEEKCHNGFNYGCYPNWLITDLRFPNEFQAVKEKNGICVRVSRPFYSTVQHNVHPSETALDKYTFDYEINNSGSIEDLVKEVRKMLINFKII